MIAECGGGGGGGESETVFVKERYAGGRQGTESNAPAFEEDDLDRSLVLRGIVHDAGMRRAVAESGVQGFVVRGDGGGERRGLQEGGEEAAREWDVVGSWVGWGVVSWFVGGCAGWGIGGSGGDVGDAVNWISGIE